MPPDTGPAPLRRLTRLAWRYRSALAPAGCAFGVLAASLIVRPAFYGPGLMPKLAVLTLVTVSAAGGLWQWGARAGLDRAIERAYAAVVTLAGGLWLEGAIVLGPLRNAVLKALAAGTLIGAIPWWWHRRIRRGERRAERGIAAWRADLERHEPGSSLGRPSFSGDGGFQIPWTLAPGRVIDDIRGAVGRLESLLDLRPGAIEVAQGDRSARDILLRVQPRDPHRTARLHAGPPRDASIRKACVIARYADGGDAGLVLVGVHLLVAGTNGSGKSGVVNIIVWYLAACRDAVLWGCDLKFGLELGPWEPVFDPGHLARTPEQAVALLEAGVRVIEYRGPELERRGLRTWPTSPADPALVIMIDEQQKLAGNRRAVEAIKTITAQGRALAVSVVIATQYPTNDALGDKLIAANMTAAVCLRVNKPAETNVALGPGAVSAGWLAHKISASKPGSLYLRAAGAEEPRLARSDQVTEPMVERAAAVLGTHRPRLDEGSEHAALGTPQSTGARHAVRTVTGPGLSTVPTAPDGTVGGPPMHTVATPPEGTGSGAWGGGQRRSAAGGRGGVANALSSCYARTRTGAPTHPRHACALEKRCRVPWTV